MTDEDADELFNIIGPEHSHYIDLKLYRYYQQKISQNPKDAKSLFQLGITIGSMGYIHSNNYVPEHIREALTYIGKAIQFAEPQKWPKYMSQKIKYHLNLNEFKEAMNVFQELHRKVPRHFNTYISAVRISVFRKNLKEAELWNVAAGRMAKEEDDKKLYHALMTDILEDQGRNKEILPHLEFLAQSDPSNAWPWHNLAVYFYGMANYDKAIEYDLKALSLAEFGAAKTLLSDAYLKKYQSLVPLGTTKRIVASVNPTIDAAAAEPSDTALADSTMDLLMNAIKHNPKNANALAELSVFYVNEFYRTRDKLHIMRGRSYLQEAAQINPNSTIVRIAFKHYARLDRNENTQRR
jgi:tetratricopeptide (TPR) repeat protein